MWINTYLFKHTRLRSKNVVLLYWVRHKQHVYQKVRQLQPDSIERRIIYVSAPVSQSVFLCWNAPIGKVLLHYKRKPMTSGHSKTTFSFWYGRFGNIFPHAKLCFRFFEKLFSLLSCSTALLFARFSTVETSWRKMVSVSVALSPGTHRNICNFVKIMPSNYVAKVEIQRLPKLPIELHLFI